MDSAEKLPISPLDAKKMGDDWPCATPARCGSAVDVCLRLLGNSFRRLMRRPPVTSTRCPQESPLGLTLDACLLSTPQSSLICACSIAARWNKKTRAEARAQARADAHALRRKGLDVIEAKPDAGQLLRAWRAAQLTRRGRKNAGAFAPANPPTRRGVVVMRRALDRKYQRMTLRLWWRARWCSLARGEDGALYDAMRQPFAASP